MPKKKTVRRSKHNKKKTPPSKKAARDKKPAPKKQPAAKKSPTAPVTFVETFEVDVITSAPDVEESASINEAVEDDLDPDIGRSE